MKIDFKDIGGEKVDYSDLFVDRHGNVYQRSTEGYLVIKAGMKPHPKMSILHENAQEKIKW